MLGRTFTPEDSKPGQNNVVVISFGLWQRRFGGDPDVIGRKVILNAEDHTIIGVMPPDFKWHIRKNSQTGQTAELWTTWEINNELRQWRGRFICAVARYKPGVTPEQARAEMDMIAGRLAEQYRQFNDGPRHQHSSAARAVRGRDSAGVAGVDVRGRIRAVDCLHERGEFAAVARNRSAKRDRCASRAGRKPFSDSEAIADREFVAGGNGRRGGSAAGVVGHRHCSSVSARRNSAIFRASGSARLCSALRLSWPC